METIKTNFNKNKVISFRKDSPISRIVIAGKHGIRENGCVKLSMSILSRKIRRHLQAPLR